jgi:RNA recognition motif-containing protein
MSKRIYVGNLSYQTTEGDLTELFEQVGQVDSVNIITDRDTGRSKGFAFVEMANDDADKAIAQFNGTEVNGRALTVNEARPREDRSSGGGGRGGRGGFGGGRGGSGGGGGGRGGRGGFGGNRY